MRLNKFEQNAIKQTFEEVFEVGEIYLFGSRVNNEKKGGDIDLYIKTKTENFQRKKITFLVKLKKLIGDQKIDVVLAKSPQSPIDKVALSNGILL